LAAAHTTVIGGGRETFTSGSSVSLFLNTSSPKSGRLCDACHQVRPLSAALKTQPVQAKSGVWESSIRHNELLPALRWPGPKHADEAAEAGTTVSSATALADRAHIVLEEARSRVDEVVSSLAQVLCSHTQQVAFGLALRVTRTWGARIKRRCSEYRPHE
jgi:hypothetical protein